MMEKLQYKNHMNEMLTFGDVGLFVNENDLRNFSWKVQSKNDKIVGFSKEITKFSVPVIVATQDSSDGVKLKNKLYEVCDKDVIVGKSGKLIIGDYYMNAFVTGCKFSDYAKGDYLTAKLTVQTDYPYWLKETTTTFGYGGGTVGKDLDYDNDFPYDYTSNMSGRQINNTGFVDCNFIMRIYGECENPEILIGEHSYKVNCSVGNNEYLTINSIKKTIILTDKYGNTTNEFSSRDRDSYVFEKIPVGVSLVSQSSGFKADITLFEERSVPKWT